MIKHKGEMTQYYKELAEKRFRRAISHNPAPDKEAWEDKKIEKINIFDYPQDYSPNGHYNEQKQFVIDRPPLNSVLMDKFNEVIDAINNLKGKK